MSTRSDSDIESSSSRQTRNSISPEASHGSHRASVYDAVAGRVASDRFIRREAFIPSTRDTAASSNAALPPDEVLFRSGNAPALYEDEDVYDYDLRRDVQPSLPDSDLVKAIHTYAADFYSRMKGSDADVSYKSLDGSALLALGILLEESCRAALGSSGDLALVNQDDGRLEPAINKVSPEPSVVEGGPVKRGGGAVEESDRDHGPRRKRKRAAT